jgi:hypothetical protein
MTVKEILMLACEFVGEGEIAQKVKNGETLNESEQKKYESLLSCFNLVNQEIASDYLPNLTKESVTVFDGKIFFSTLSKNATHIYEVGNRFGMSLPFKNFSNYVEVGGQPKYVVYSFLPDELGEDEVFEFYGGLSARILAYGIASEFLLVSGLGDEAEVWEERFKESLFVLSRKRGEHRLPKRSWL